MANIFLRKIKTVVTRKKVAPVLRMSGLGFGVLVFIYVVASANLFPLVVMGDTPGTATTTARGPMLDKSTYDKKMLAIAQAPTSTWAAYLSATSSVAGISLPSFVVGSTTKKLAWPVQNLPYPLPGALLPAKRIVAYYGNFYSTGMGVLGQYPRGIAIQKLKAAVAEWQAADPTTPVVPAINYIDITAQGSAGKDGKYRLRMPDSQIDIALDYAKEVNGIVILDIQVGLSNLQTELPLLEKYLSMPNVHLGLDPEFAMHNGQKPGDYVGSFDAADINYAADYLANLVKTHNLPPKVMVIHRFTQRMVTNYKNIQPLPEVQMVMDMDGWGSPERKIGTYQAFIQKEPVQFTGFKLFYKNDLKKPSTRLLTPAELLKMTPQPMFIQYQ